MGRTGFCQGNMHSSCPGYYRIAHLCDCPCHRPEPVPPAEHPACSCPCHAVVAPGLVECPVCAELEAK